MSAQLEELIEREYKAQVQQAQLEMGNKSGAFFSTSKSGKSTFHVNALESIRLKACVKGVD